MSLLFSDCEEHRVDTGMAEIFARVGGRGPPLLLLHGFPQTHTMWHRLAPALMKSFTCVMPDLRGYGFSSCPDNDSHNVAYSKRAMGQDMMQLMASLGHRRFAVAGHDRGARVGYRLALDHPDSVGCLALLDIASTYDIWHNFTVKLAMRIYHWLFLAQPHPLPEMLIEQNPAAFLDFTMASWTKAGDLSAFDPEALAEYRLHYATPEHVHATCNDYRAGQSSDLAADEADRAAGKKIACPTLSLWGTAGIPSGITPADLNVEDNQLAAWRQWCTNVSGAGIDSGHFLAEENPEETLSHLLPFLARHGVR